MHDDENRDDWMRRKREERKRRHREQVQWRRAGRAAALIRRERMAAARGDEMPPGAGKVADLPAGVREQIADAVHGKTSAGTKVERHSANLSTWDVRLAPPFNRPPYGPVIRVVWSARRQVVAEVLETMMART